MHYWYMKCDGFLCNLFCFHADPLQPIRCGVITQQFLADELGLVDTDEIIMIRTFNESLVGVYTAEISQRGVTLRPSYNPSIIPCTNIRYCCSHCNVMEKHGDGLLLFTMHAFIHAAHLSVPCGDSSLDRFW